MSQIKRQGNYRKKWNTDTVKQFIKDNNIEVELLSEYVDMYEKMLFRCKCGNLFETNWHEFNNKKFPKRQCNECGRKKTNTTKKNSQNSKRPIITCKYISDYLKKHGYTCKLISTEYIDCDSKLEFECECGNRFFASWSNIKKMSGLCKECTSLKRSVNIRKSDDNLQQQIDEIYGENQFTLLDRFFSRIKVKHLVCQNEFEIKQCHFIDGQGCKFCNLKNRDFGALTNEEFLKRVSGCISDFVFLSEYKNNHTPIVIKCERCGNIFQQIPYHIFDRGIYCNSCNGTKGEQSIERYLRINNIDFIAQYRFEDCKDKKPLPFDFYLPDYNICIEYQGIQHYKPIEYFGGENRFIGQTKRDAIKREYCQNNNITLLEISYKEFNDIDKILDSLLCDMKAVI